MYAMGRFKSCVHIRAFCSVSPPLEPASTFRLYFPIFVARLPFQ